MSNTYEICFTGQIDSISPEDVDFILQIEVTDVVNTKGTFSLQASDPSEFYGEKYLEWNLSSGDFYKPDESYEEGFFGHWLNLTNEEKESLADTYQDKIEELLWEAIDTERDEEYIDAHEPRYPEEDWK